MRLALRDRLQAGTQNAVQPMSVTSPIGGWNTRDALDAMQPNDAVLLDNWYPDAGGVVIRQGSASYATGMGSSPTKTVAEYWSGATHKLLAASGGAIYDVSSSGAVGGALSTGYTSDVWQTESFGGKLWFWNGADTAQVFDGSSLADQSWSGGITVANIIGGVQYQGRLFMWEKNAQGFWYAGLNAVSGSTSFFDLSMVAPLGGNLIAAVTFSHDGGNGVQDYIAFIFSAGDVMMYYGNDPSQSSGWSLIGKYRIAAPVNPRAVCRYGAEAFVTTYDDHVPLQQQLVALKVGQLPPRSKISPSVQAAVAANQNGFGWQALYYPTGRRLIYNIPDPDGVTFTQHVYNCVTDAWCRFKGMSAYCWANYMGNLYYGGPAGTVYQADIGSTDVGGVAIVADGQQAWTMMQGNTRRRIGAMRSLVQCDTPVTFLLTVGFDYHDTGPTISATTNQIMPLWDVARWDVSYWASDVRVDTRWRVATGSGQALSARLRISATQSNVKWLRTDYRVEPGNAL